MSESIGFNITPDSGTSLRKVLKYELDSHLDTLDAISAAASKVRRVHVHVHTCTLYIHCHLLYVKCIHYNGDRMVHVLFITFCDSFVFFVGIQFRTSNG